MPCSSIIESRRVMSSEVVRISVCAGPILFFLLKERERKSYSIYMRVVLL